MGHEEFSERGPNLLNYVQHTFPGWAKSFAGGISPLRTIGVGAGKFFGGRLYFIGRIYSKQGTSSTIFAQTFPNFP